MTVRFSLLSTISEVSSRFLPAPSPSGSSLCLSWVPFLRMPRTGLFLGMTAYYEIQGHISSSGEYCCGFATFLCSQLPSSPFVLFSLHLVIPHCSVLNANQTAAFSLSITPLQIASRRVLFFIFILSICVPDCLTVYRSVCLSACMCVCVWFWHLLLTSESIIFLQLQSISHSFSSDGSPYVSFSGC